MAARLNQRHQEMVREKIKASQLITRLTNHALGMLTKPMDSTQVQAALGLLKKCVPDLSAVDHSGEIEHQHVALLPVVAKDKDEWAQRYTLPSPEKRQ